MNNVKLLPSLLIFAEVASRKSFTHAASQLGMSKSAVSQQVKKLEDQIGQQLLSRNTRGMSITTAGQKLLDRCALLRGQVDLAFEEVSLSKESPSGRFALTAPHSCEKEIIVPALHQLCLEFPNIEPEVFITDQSKDLIQDQLDVAIYAGVLKDSNYRALSVGGAEEVLCATPRFVQRYGEIATPEELLSLRMVVTSWQKQGLAVYKNNALSEKIIVKPSFCLKTNTLSCAANLVLRDMGVALLPQFYVQAEIAEGRLIRVMPDYQGWQWPFYLVHRFQSEKPAHITRFHTLVKHFFTKMNGE